MVSTRVMAIPTEVAQAVRHTQKDLRYNFPLTPAFPRATRPAAIV